MDDNNKRDIPVYEQFCFYCLAVKRGKNRAKSDCAKEIPPEGVQAVKNQYDDWKKRMELPQEVMKALSVLDEAFKDSDTPSLRWHRETKCRTTFMSKIYVESFPLQPTAVRRNSASVENEE